MKGQGIRLKIKKDLSGLLKVLMDSALRIMSGRLFQAVGPANAKARLPNSSRVRDDLAVDDETGTHIDLM